jgi:hypothetical protein
VHKMHAAVATRTSRRPLAIAVEFSGMEKGRSFGCEMA